MKLDPILRSIPKDSQDKINAWIKDQYTHPVEHTHTFDEILIWFKENNIEFINSLPDCSLFKTSKNSFFEKSSKGIFFERIIQQLLMIFSRHGSEGEYLYLLGKKLIKSLVVITITGQMLFFYLAAYLWKFDVKHNRLVTLQDLYL